MKNVFCMKWGTKFPADYVNRLYSMVKRHLPPPFRFVCFTDDRSGLNDGIEIRLLPEIQLDKALPERGWRKLTILGSNISRDNLDSGLTGQALFLDLDVVITGDLQPFFDEKGEFIIVHEWGFSDKVIGNSSVFRFNIGQHQDVLDNFLEHGEEVRSTYRNEQAYLSHSIHKKGMLTYWNEEWCRSFKRHCLRPFPLCYVLPPKLPENARIIVFHGNPNPDAVQQGWVGHCGLRAAKPADWIDKNWR